MQMPLFGHFHRRNIRANKLKTTHTPSAIREIFVVDNIFLQDVLKKILPALCPSQGVLFFSFT